MILFVWVIFMFVVVVFFVVYVMDVCIGNEIYLQNVNIWLYLVLLIKMMMFYMVFNVIECGQVWLDSKFLVFSYVVVQLLLWLGLCVGQWIELCYLICVVVVKLVNDVVIVIGENIVGLEQKFVVQMIVMVKVLGMNNIQFCNVNGLIVEGYYLIVYDMLVLGCWLFYDYL